MNIKKHIPNFITILNLVCGVLAIMCFFEAVYQQDEFTGLLTNCFGPNTSKIEQGIWLIFLASLFDFLDGFVARLLNVKSEIGAQLDSLADMVTFGVAPGFLFFAITNVLFPELEWVTYFFVLIPVFSAIRLAKFNIDSEQSDNFKGLATPANTLFWAGLFFVIEGPPFYEYAEFILPFLIITFSFLMISNLRMFSLKLKSLKWEGDNIYRVLLIMGTIILTILFGLFTNILAAVPFIILLYILLSLSYHYSTRNIK